MIDSALFLNELLTRAQKNSNASIINKLKNVEFINSLNETTELLGSLGFYLKDKYDSDNKLDQHDIYIKIAHALVRNFFTTYYINLNTGMYVGYSSSEDYNTLKIETNGSNFFKDVNRNIPNTIYKDDQELLFKTFQKNYLINETNEGKIFKLRYRLLLNNNPTYILLSAIRIGDNDLIVGLRNIDEIAKKEIEYQNTIQESLTYTNIALALSINYFGVFYVNIKTDDYERYDVDNQRQTIEKIEDGKDFFYVSTIHAKKYVYKDDLDKFSYALRKENLLNELKNNHLFNMEYRQIINGIPTYVSLKVVNLLNDSDHIVIAMSNIDMLKKKENEYRKQFENERHLARTDGLTGCYNKNYLIEFETEINEKIKNKTIKELSVVLCDINDLKIINDTLGHECGDKYILDATNIINSTFNESLIFRIGGDEFLIIIHGNDYKKRNNLFKKLIDSNIKNKKEKKVVIAFGYSDYDSIKDSSLNEIIKRADK